MVCGVHTLIRILQRIGINIDTQGIYLFAVIAFGQEIEQLETQVCTLKRLHIRTVRNSLSYRLGTTLVQAVANPGRNTIFLPYRLFRLCAAEFKKRKALTAKSDKYT